MLHIRVKCGKTIASVLLRKMQVSVGVMLASWTSISGPQMLVISNNKLNHIEFVT